MAHTDPLVVRPRLCSSAAYCAMNFAFSTLLEEDPHPKLNRARAAVGLRYATWRARAGRDNNARRSALPQ